MMPGWILLRGDHVPTTIFCWVITLREFLDEIEPLKQAALSELKAAADLAALDQADVAEIA
jgi:hypothetical protein